MHRFSCPVKKVRQGYWENFNIARVGIFIPAAMAMMREMTDKMMFDDQGVAYNDNNDDDDGDGNII